MFRKTSTRLIRPLHRFLSWQQTKPDVAKSVMEREHAERREPWHAVDEDAEVDKKLNERQKKAEEERENIRNLFARPTDAPPQWQSKFKFFFPGERDYSLLIWMQQPWDFHPQNLLRLWRDFQLRKEAFMQSYLKDRFTTLGPELAVAHFILYRDGKIKFKGNDKWFVKADVDSLPTKYDAKFWIEAINFDNQPLHYEGVENITDLRECRSISLRNTKHFNDWCLDRLTGNHLPKLEELDISGTDVTQNGFSCIYKMQALKRLIVDKSNRNTIEDQLIFAMVEELRWDLFVLDSAEAAQDCPVASKEAPK